MAGLKDTMIDDGYKLDVVDKFCTYYSSIPADKSGQKIDATKAYNLFKKFYNSGVIIDGVNAIFSGTMVQVTYHGYKNALYKAYPDSQIDVQIVRQGDEFSFSKDSGKVDYTHKIANPFADSKIVGAYCIIKNRRGEFLELLNETDYLEMKSASKTQFTWNKWASEFWRKSVIKRACKTHFYDVVQVIDEEDNKGYALPSEDTLNAIVEANKGLKDDTLLDRN